MDAILLVMISHSVVLFVVFCPKGVLPGVMFEYIFWLRILRCAMVYITGSLILITTSVWLGVGKMCIFLQAVSLFYMIV